VIDDGIVSADDTLLGIPTEFKLMQPVNGIIVMMILVVIVTVVMTCKSIISNHGYSIRDIDSV